MSIEHKIEILNFHCTNNSVLYLTYQLSIIFSFLFFKKRIFEGAIRYKT